MGQTCRLIFGAIEIELAGKSGLGFRLPRPAQAPTRFTGSEENPIFVRVVESYNLSLVASSDNDVASRIEQLFGVLRAAKLFGDGGWQITPVYLKEQLPDEANARYALVYGSPDMEIPDLFHSKYRATKWVENFGLSITRGIWRSAPPTALPTATTLTEVGGADTGSIFSVVTGDRVKRSIDKIFNWTVASGWGFDLWGSVNSTLFPNRTAGDILYLASTTNTNVPSTVGFDVVTASDAANNTFAWEYYNGAWTALGRGVTFGMLGPNGLYTYSDPVVFGGIGRWFLNFQVPLDSTALLLNGLTRHWVRIRITAAGTWTVSPVLSATQSPWVPAKNIARIPAAAVGGKRPPFVNIRIRGLDGPAPNEAQSPSPMTISQAIVGLRSNRTGFVSMLGLWNPPTGWTKAAGTDASAINDFRGAEQYAVRTSFATQTSIIYTRHTLTGTDKLTDWRGEYMVFIRARQNAGAIGDCAVTFSCFIGRDASVGEGAVRYGLNYDIGGVKLQSIDKYELVYCGTLKISFEETVSADDLTTSVFFRIHNQRNAGAATVDNGDIILIPIDEWAAILSDPLSDVSVGTSALRRCSGLDLDNGLLRQRLSKYQMGSDGGIHRVEPWELRGEPPRLEPGVINDLHFLACHYPSTWGAGPWLAATETMMGVQVYIHDVYDVLRGSG